jgi:acetyl-CoA synthetase
MRIATGEDLQAQLEIWLSRYGATDIRLAELLCDRHAQDAGRVALRYEDAARRKAEYTFVEMLDRSARFAGVLRDLGVSRGDRVAVLLPKSPELMIAVLGLWRVGAVHVPLFTAFGPEAVGFRVSHSGARVVVTDSANRGKVETSPGASGNGGVRVVVVEDSDVALEASDIPFRESIETAPPVTEAASYAGTDPFVMIYTSGTTGPPKGALCSVRLMAEIEAYMSLGLDLRDDDSYWNMADPGWAHGFAFALTGPLLMGHSTLFVNMPFDPALTLDVLERYGVTNFVSAPTAYRMLRAAGVSPQQRRRLRVRVATSCGEPLNPELIAWSTECLGIPIHDHYGQTEAGMPIVNHHHPLLGGALRPGSMGRAAPGYRVVVVDDNGKELGPGQEGQLALDIQRSPMFYFGGYHKEPDRTAERFVANGRYYLTGDDGSCDSDGYFYFSGRADDVIKSAGYRIGPFDVESALIGHDAVVEAAVVGKPDPLKGHTLKAFVMLREGVKASDELAGELRLHVKSRLGAHAYPREIEFVTGFPKTPSGKIQRFLLRER